jgi:hypothetical protein
MLHIDPDHLTFAQALVLSLSIVGLVVAVFITALFGSDGDVGDHLWDDRDDHVFKPQDSGEPHLRTEYGDPAAESEFTPKEG